MTSPGLFIDTYIPHVYSEALRTRFVTDVPYWISKSRPMSSDLWEIVKINFRQAVLITSINFELLKISQEYEVFYTNRNGIVIPLTLVNGADFEGVINSGAGFTNVPVGQVSDLSLDENWQKVSAPRLYPSVATSVEIRLRRIPDENLDTDAVYKLGIRKLSLKRTIATEQNKFLAITDSVDRVGNFVTKQFVDWEPTKAVDGNELTFWKCSGQPDTNAVVAFYMDVRQPNGEANTVDKVWIDPVYTGQQINVYYSNDDTEGLATLSPTKLPAEVQTDALWTFLQGFAMTEPTSELVYDGTNLGLIDGENLWLAGVWAPNFDSSDTVGSDLDIFTYDTISLVYDDSAKTLTATVGMVSVTSSTLGFSAGDTMKIFIQIRTIADDDPGITFLVYHDFSLAEDLTVAGNVGTINFSSNMTFAYNSGHLQQWVIKRGDWLDIDIEQFVSSPSVYLSPDPVLVSGDEIPSTTLDNAVFAGEFSASQFAFFGASFHKFADKMWSPVWKNFLSNKGYLLFPQPVSTKYLKLEFTKLTPEPYPIFDPDIEVSYKTFPVTVTRTSELQHIEYTGTTFDSRTNTETQIDPSNLVDRFGNVYGPEDVVLRQDVVIEYGNAVYDTIPHTFDTPPLETLVTETTSSKVVSAVSSTDTQVIASANYYTVQKGDTLIGIASKLGILDWHTLYNDNKEMIDKDPRVKRLPKRSPGWWIFPGQRLRVSAEIMEEFTRTTTITEHVTPSTLTNKFTMTSVHRYDFKTVKRDAAIAYFTGLREVMAYYEDLIIAADSESFTVNNFYVGSLYGDNSNYTFGNVEVTRSNSLVNLVTNPNFDIGIQNIRDANAIPTHDVVTSFALSDDFSFSGSTSLKVTFSGTGTNPQGVFYRIVGLPANAFVAVTARVLVPVGDTDVALDGTVTVTDTGEWTKVEKVMQASGSGVLTVRFASVGEPGSGDLFYLDALGAFVVSAANSEVPNFVDGNFAAAEWSWDADDSKSVAILQTFGEQTPYAEVGANSLTALTNHVTNPSFEVDTAGWTSGAGTPGTVSAIDRVTTEHYRGVASLRVTWDTDTGRQGVGISLTGLTDTATYVAFAKVKNAAGDTTPCLLTIDGVADGYLSSELLRGQWQKLEVRWTQSGTTATLCLVSDDAVATDLTYLDEVAVFQITSIHDQAPDYFDGSVPGHDWTGTAHASTSESTQIGTLVSPNYNTFTAFKKIIATLEDRSLETILSGLDGATSIGVGDSALATWDDPLSAWSDAMASWGAASSLATVSFVSDYVYNGVNSIWIHRDESGVGGVYSAPITPFTGAHVRAEITVFLPSSANITNTVKIVDAATPATVYLQETITSPRGGWQTYVTNFIVSDGSEIMIAIESDGSVSSDLYIADMSIKQTTVGFFVSNDNGTNWYDATDIVNKTNFPTFVFPSASNQLRVKIEMLRTEDWISGWNVIPFYLS